MMCMVQGNPQKQDFAATIRTQMGPLACMMGVHLEAFWQLPQSGWRFYTQGDGEAPFALAVWGTAAQLIYQAAPPDAEELASFCAVMGVQSLQCAQPLHGWQVVDTAQRFDWRTDALPQPTAARADGYAINTQPSLLAATEFLDRNGQFSRQGAGASDAFYARSCALVNRGLAQLYTAELGGEIAATVFASAQWDGWAYLSAIETQENHRRKGLAAWLIGDLCRHLLGQNQRPTLLCRPEMTAFYAKIGFQPAGEVLRYQPPNSPRKDV